MFFWARSRLSLKMGHLGCLSVCLSTLSLCWDNWNTFLQRTFCYVVIENNMGHGPLCSPEFKWDMFSINQQSLFSRGQLKESWCQVILKFDSWFLTRKFFRFSIWICKTKDQWSWAAHLSTWCILKFSLRPPPSQTSILDILEASFTRKEIALALNKIID